MSASKDSAEMTIPSFEELFLDAYAYPSLRIPPLRSMFPASSSDRLDTLEPSTNLQRDDQSSKLTGRQMALAQAKSMEDLKPSDLEALEPSIAPAPDAPMVNHALAIHNRKRRKLGHEEQVLDFVTLPKPKPRPKLEEGNKKPFRPVAVLNQLNEPPPSAAMFPPITPSQELQGAQQSQPAAINGGDSQQHEDAGVGAGAGASTDTPVKSKRLRLRSRQMWTKEETSDLLEGVAIMGIGRWKDILTHPKFRFQASRTHVDLKDRFRVLFPQAQPEKWGNVGKQPDYDLKLRFERPNNRKVPTGKKMPYRSWSEAEDLELHKGFYKHGYQWHLIAKDETLSFNDRSSTQIRDRFRRLHPHVYTETPPTNAKDAKPKRGRGRPPGSKKTDEASTPWQGQDKGQVRETNGDEKHTSAPIVGYSAPAFLDGLLNESYDETDSEFSRSLAELDDQLEDNIHENITSSISENLRLPPVHWDEMAVQPIFDLG